MYFYDFKCVVDFWTNQTILKLTYCNLHHHFVSLNIKNNMYLHINHLRNKFSCRVS